MPITMIPNERFGPSGQDFAAAEQAQDRRATRPHRISLLKAQEAGARAQAQREADEAEFARSTQGARRDILESERDLKANDVAASNRVEAAEAGMRVAREETHNFLVQRAMSDPAFNPEDPDHEAMISGLVNAGGAFADTGDLGVFNPRLRPWIEERIAEYDGEMAAMVRQRTAAARQFERDQELAEAELAQQKLTTLKLAEDAITAISSGGNSSGATARLRQEAAKANADLGEAIRLEESAKLEWHAAEESFAGAHFPMDEERIKARANVDKLADAYRVAVARTEKANDLYQFRSSELSRVGVALDAQAKRDLADAYGITDIIEDAGLSIPYVDAPSAPPVTEPDRGSPDPDPVADPPVSVEPEVASSTIAAINGFLQTGEASLSSGHMEQAYAALSDMGIPSTLGGLGRALNRPPLNQLSEDDIMTLQQIVLHLSEARPIEPGTIGERPGTSVRSQGAIDRTVENARRRIESTRPLADDLPGPGAFAG